MFLNTSFTNSSWTLGAVSQGWVFLYKMRGDIARSRTFIIATRNMTTEEFFVTFSVSLKHIMIASVLTK